MKPTKIIGWSIEHRIEPINIPPDVQRFVERELSRIETCLYRDLCVGGVSVSTLRLTPQGPSFGIINWDGMLS